MDIWGFVIIAVSAILYYYTRKRSSSAASFFLVTFGVGIGIVIGAIWVITYVNQTLAGYGISP